jgi:hypothetical protein
MTYIILWVLGFGSFWAGLTLFDDEVILIVTALTGAVLVIAGLMTAPPTLQMIVEISLIIVLFNLCMKCIERGNSSD